MKIFRTKVWKVFDLASLKWSSILFGSLFGGYFPGFIKRHEKPIATLAILLALKTATSYFSDNTTD